MRFRGTRLLLVTTGAGLACSVGLAAAVGGAAGRAAVIRTGGGER